MINGCGPRPRHPPDRKRLRAAGPLISTAIRRLALITPTSAPILRLIESTPVPCGASRETAHRSDLAGQDAAGGYGDH